MTAAGPAGILGLSCLNRVQAIDWLWILHPALAVVVLYPLIGMVARLGLQVRQRRDGATALPARVGGEHADLGHWLAVGVVAVSLVALSVVIASTQPLAGGAPRAGLLLLVLLGTLTALLALWRAQRPILRLVFALLTWLGVLSLGSQPEVYRLSDNPLSAEFWQSHYWSAMAVVGLMLFSLGARREILSQRRWRRLHVSSSILAAVLFVGLGISGSRDLLQIPLSWQKPALSACDWSAQRCQPPASPQP